MHIAQGYAAWIRAKENQQFLKKSRRINKDPSVAFLALLCTPRGKRRVAPPYGQKSNYSFFIFRAVACQPAIRFQSVKFFHKLQNF